MSSRSWVFLLINNVCLDEKQQISMMQVFILTRLGLEPTIYWTCYYTTDEVRNFEEKNGHIVENLLIVIYQRNTQDNVFE
jgi:hypothetical protein